MWQMALHSWVGIVVAAYMTLLFLTGTLTLYGFEIQAIFNSGMWASETEARASFGEIYDGVKEADPEYGVVRIAAPPTPYVGAMIGLRTPDGDRFGWADPATGELTDVTAQRGIRAHLRDFHADLYARHWTGRVAVTSVAFLLLAQIVTGLLSYRRFWKGLFRLPKTSQPARAWWGTLHRLLALWALPVMVVMALTSVAFFADGLGFYPGKPEAERPIERESRLPEGFAGADVDRAVAIAREALPDLEVTAVRLPAVRKQPITVSGTSSAWLTGTEANEVKIDPATFEVLGVVHAGEFGPVARAYFAAVPLHFADFGGEVVRVIWAISGAFMVLVSISGMVIFARRIRGAETGTLTGVYWRGMPLAGRLVLTGVVLGAALMYVVRYANLV